MKPTKNKVFCIGCHKAKMLFQSLAKANNFIRYNSGEILETTGKAPVRSYFCAFCGGYHVTSNPSEESGGYLDQLDEQRISKLLPDTSKEEPVREIAPVTHDKVRELLLSLSEPVRKAKASLYFGEMEDAALWLGKCHEILSKIEEKTISQYRKMAAKKLEIKRIGIKDMKD